MMFGLHETMQSRMHAAVTSSLKEEPSGGGLLGPGGPMQHLMHHHHHHHHPHVRNWMQPSAADQAAALARFVRVVELLLWHVDENIIQMAALCRVAINSRRLALKFLETQITTSIHCLSR
jgi:hypothetical protein